MRETWVSEICSLVKERYLAFGGLQRRIQHRASVCHRRAVACKSLLIILGALSTVKAVAEQFMGARNGSAVFAALGAAMAITAGLDAAFAPEKVSGELSGLAAECASTRSMIEFTWNKILMQFAGSAARAARLGVPPPDSHFDLEVPDWATSALQPGPTDGLSPLGTSVDGLSSKFDTATVAAPTSGRAIRHDRVGGRVLECR